MAHANFNVGVKAIFQNNEGQILGLTAHDNGPMAGYNDMPGGRIEESEVGTDLKKILEREIAEEIGSINYTIEPKPVAVVTWKWPNGQDMIFVYYLAKYESGEMHLSDEHLGHTWINKTGFDEYFTTYHNEALKQYLSQ